METVSYGGWDGCRRLRSGDVELIVTTEVGPRILFYGRSGGDNELHVAPRPKSTPGPDEWVNYGGHRLWHAPEIPPRNMAPDNDAVQVEAVPGGAVFVQPTEASTGLQKAIEIVGDDRGGFRIRHRLTNHNLWAVEAAVWPISVMAAGGTAIVPMPPRGVHPEVIAPSNPVVLWGYTDMADPRFVWGRECILVHHDGQAEQAQKVGTWVPAGWVAYARAGRMVLKTFELDAEAFAAGRYPDMGSNVEVFTNADILEVETLGPRMQIQPGQTVEHAERWSLLDDVAQPRTEAETIAQVMPRVAAALRETNQ